jgi:regulator of protease activity HflC (stomatin/prohibitin superfamily)
MHKPHIHSSADWFFGDDILNKIIRHTLAISLFLLFLGIGVFWTNQIEGDKDLIRAARFMLAPLAAIGLAILIAARYIQDIYEIPSYLACLKYILAAIFGLLYPVLRIVDGRAVFDQDENNIFDKLRGPSWLINTIGGPGNLFIEPGNIVLLERLDSPSNVLGAGRHFVNRFHRIKNVISLEDQQASPRDVNAITKDGITVTARNFQFSFRIETGHRKAVELAQRSMLNPYPFSISAAKNMTYNRSITKDGNPVPWEKAVQFSIDSGITDYINRHYLDDILFPPKTQDEPRKQMGKDITENKRFGLKMYGAELLWYDIGTFDVDQTIVEQMIKAWHAKRAGNMAILQAQGEAMQIASEGRGRAEGEANMLSSITQALNDANLPDDIDENMWHIVLSRTAQIIEAMSRVYSTEDIPEEKEE